MRLDSNIKSKSLNNTYLNIIKIFFSSFKNIKFSNNINLRKQVFLSAEKITIFIQMFIFTLKTVSYI